MGTHLGNAVGKGGAAVEGLGARSEPAQGRTSGQQHIEAGNNTGRPTGQIWAPQHTQTHACMTYAVPPRGKPDHPGQAVVGQSKDGLTRLGNGVGRGEAEGEGEGDAEGCADAHRSSRAARAARGATGATGATRTERDMFAARPRYTPRAPWGIHLREAHTEAARITTSIL